MRFIVLTDVYSAKKIQEKKKTLSQKVKLNFVWLNEIINLNFDDEFIYEKKNFFFINLYSSTP